MHRTLVARGVAFSQPPTDMDYLWREARFADPDGHDLRVAFMGANRLAPPWRVHGAPEFAPVANARPLELSLRHVTLVVAEWEACRDFYVRVLGLVPIVDEAPRYARLAFARGEATLSIEKTDHARSPATAEQNQLFFQVAEADLANVADELARRGARFASRAPKLLPYLWREAKFADPHGSDLRLVAYGPDGRNRLDPPWRVGRDPWLARLQWAWEYYVVG